MRLFELLVIFTQKYISFNCTLNLNVICIFSGLEKSDLVTYLFCLCLPLKMRVYVFKGRKVPKHGNILLLFENVASD